MRCKCCDKIMNEDEYVGKVYTNGEEVGDEDMCKHCRRESQRLDDGCYKDMDGYVHNTIGHYIWKGVKE